MPNHVMTDKVIGFAAQRLHQFGKTTGHEMGRGTLNCPQTTELNHRKLKQKIKISVVACERHYDRNISVSIIA